MSLKNLGRRLTTPNPRLIEVLAILAAFVVVIAGIATICEMPHTDFTRDKVLSVLSVVISALGVASLLFLWAQLRHTATQDKLVAYHEHFQDLPKAAKVSALYREMGRLKIERPLWQTPLTPAQRDQILAQDKSTAPDTADIAIREYLNDFEEFAAAVNVGLLDDEYVYHIESARILNAYYGFEEMIGHWLADEQQKAHKRDSGIAPSDYYGELKKLAERWKTRKLEEVAEDERQRRRKGIPERL